MEEFEKIGAEQPQEAVPEADESEPTTQKSNTFVEYKGVIMSEEEFRRTKEEEDK